MGMASTPSFSSIIFFIAVSGAAAAAASAGFKWPPVKEKTTHLQFYLHDTITGARPSSIEVAKPPGANSSFSTFGAVFVVDDPLTETPSAAAPLVGRAQGTYIQASQEGVIALLLAFNFVITSGEHNGSTFTALGRDRILDAVRELPVVGGTGEFRLARGFVTFKTNSVNLNTGNAVIHVEAFLLHY